MRTLVLGGIRSGKSRWAENAIAESVPSETHVRYVAAGSPSVDATSDSDWALRVEHHRRRRPAHWSTVETSDVATELRGRQDSPTLIDDLGRWLTGVLDARHGWDGPVVPDAVHDEVDEMVSAVADFASTLILVSPEVGLTIVPATPSGRRFADELGALNQRMAAVCDRVVLVVAGQPVPIKPAAGPVPK